MLHPDDVRLQSREGGRFRFGAAPRKKPSLASALLSSSFGSVAPGKTGSPTRKAGGREPGFTDGKDVGAIV